MSEYLNEFVQESEESITELNNALLDLERNPDDGEAMDEVFRTAHTLKGNASAMGFTAASDLAHAIEDLLDAIRAGSLEVSPDLMDEVFEGVDVLDRLVDEVDEYGETRTDPSDRIEALRSRIEEGTGLTKPDDEEVAAMLGDAPGVRRQHRAFHARLSLSEEPEAADRVVEAVRDAFDLLATDPDEDRIAGGDYAVIDVAFGSAVDEAAIAAAFEPVDAVEDAIITEVPEEAVADARARSGAASEAAAAGPSTAEAEEMEVDELLDEFDEYDDLDEAVERVDDVPGLENMGDAGAFDDIVEEEVTPAHEEGEGDAEAPGGPPGDEPEEVEDPQETFSELQDEYDEVGIDRMEDELEGVSFGEYDAEDEVGFDQLLGEDFEPVPEETEPADVRADVPETADAADATGSADAAEAADVGTADATEPVETPDAEEAVEAPGPADEEPAEPSADEPPTAEPPGDEPPTAEPTAVEPPDDEAVEAAVAAADPPVAADRRSFFARVGLAAAAGREGARRVVEALRDAFDLLGTRPPESEIRAGEAEDSVDAVFGSDVGETQIRAALEPIEGVTDAELVEVTDRMPAPEPGEAAEPAGAVEGDADAADLPEDAAVPAEGEFDEEVVAAEGEIQDAMSEFQQMQAAYDEVGLDEMEDELEGVSFGEYDAEDEVGFEELLGDDLDEVAGVEAEAEAEPAEAEAEPAEAEAEPAEAEAEPAEAEAEPEEEAEPTAAEPAEVPEDDEAVASPGEEAIDAAVAAADPPRNAAHEVYFVRLGIFESDRYNNGQRVVEALRDAFDLLGTVPPESEIRVGEVEDSVDAVFGSHVGESEIRSALDPVDEVAGAEVVEVTDRAPAAEPAEPGEADAAGAGSAGAVDVPPDAEVSAMDEFDEEVVAAEGEIQDAASEFEQMQAAYDEVGLDEMADELEGVSFGEYDAEDEVGFDELVDEETFDVEPATGEAFGDADEEFGEVGVGDDFGEVETGEVGAGTDEFGEADEDLGEVGVGDDFGEVEADEAPVGDAGDLGGAADVGVEDVEVGEFTLEEDSGEDFGDVEVGEFEEVDVDGEDFGEPAETVERPEEAGEDVTIIKGIGSSYADRLGEAGVETVGDLVTADPEVLATATEISESRIAEWIDRAPVAPEDLVAAEPADAEPAADAAGPASADATDADAGTAGTDAGTGEFAGVEPGAEDFGEVEPGTDDFAEPEPEGEADEAEAEAEPEPEPSIEPEHEIDEVQSIRVDVDRVDDLLNLVEGLVTTRARLRRAVEEGAPREQLVDELEELDVISSEMQDAVVEMRLVPFRTVTERLPRVVRDVSREAGKQVRFETEGEAVEVDRSILNRIGDPLVHLVRNAVDHGIEPPEEREAAGKDPEGVVTVRARRERDLVVVEVADDGRGLDPDRLRDAAVEAGTMDEVAAAALDDEDTYDLIFESGFSTSDEVTDVSGRGVGMDVVASTVDELDGEVEVESTPGEGTTVRMVLPVTVAISEMLFLESGDEEYGLPVGVVDEIGAMGMAETVSAEGDRQVVRTADGRQRELIRLHEALEVPDPAAADGGGMLVTVEGDVRECAIHCDNVRGQQEVVVKPFEGLLSGIPGLSGAAILGEGAVVNILDVETL